MRWHHRIRLDAIVFIFTCLKGNVVLAAVALAYLLSKTKSLYTPVLLFYSTWNQFSFWVVRFFPETVWNFPCTWEKHYSNVYENSQKTPGKKFFLYFCINFNICREVFSRTTQRDCLSKGNDTLWNFSFRVFYEILI